MIRYLGISLLIGLSVSLVIWGLYQTDFFDAVRFYLAEFYATSPFISEVGVDYQWLHVSMFSVLAIWIAWTTVDIPRVLLKVAVAAFALIITLTLSPVLALFHVFYEPVSGVFAILGSLTLGLLYSRTEQGSRKLRFRNLLGDRVSSKTFRQLLHTKYPPDLKGEKRNVTVVTCSLFDHRNMGTQLEGQDVVEITNLFLKATAEFLIEKGAYMDESAPDCVRGIFGMPLVMEDHATTACRAAVELRTRLKNLSKHCEATYYTPLQWGISVSSGSMTTGVFGENDLAHFSGVGGLTDFTRRLSGANAHYQSEILIGHETNERAEDDIVVRPIEMLYDVRTGMMYEVYELLGMQSEVPEDILNAREAFWQGVVLYRRNQFEEASIKFQEALDVRESEDPTCEHFLKAAQQGGVFPSPNQSETDAENASPSAHARLLSSL